MGFLRYLLFPFSILYLVIVSLRNFFFSIGIFNSKTYAVPSLGIGNLSTGGTGKSVAINYFISLFKDQYPITVLSRGYGRISKGFQLGDTTSTPLCWRPKEGVLRDLVLCPYFCFHGPKKGHNPQLTLLGVLPKRELLVLFASFVSNFK